jgi:hypothetical protein
MRLSSRPGCTAVVVMALLVTLAFISLFEWSPERASSYVDLHLILGPTCVHYIERGHRTDHRPYVALGMNNPAQGDCSTNTSEAATSVGYVVLTVTSSSFQAQIQLQKGSPDSKYAVFMQQVPGSCPQLAANGGSLLTGSTGRGHAFASVPRVGSATTFFVQLVPIESGSPEYTSDRIARVS